MRLAGPGATDDDVAGGKVTSGQVPVAQASRLHPLTTSPSFNVLSHRLVIPACSQIRHPGRLLAGIHACHQVLALPTVLPLGLNRSSPLIFASESP